MRKLLVETVVGTTGSAPVYVPISLPASLDVTTSIGAPAPSPPGFDLVIVPATGVIGPFWPLIPACSIVPGTGVIGGGSVAWDVRIYYSTSYRRCARCKCSVSPGLGWMFDRPGLIRPGLMRLWWFWGQSVPFPHGTMR